MVEPGSCVLNKLPASEIVVCDIWLVLPLLYFYNLESDLKCGQPPSAMASVGLRRAQPSSFYWLKKAVKDLDLNLDFSDREHAILNTSTSSLEEEVSVRYWVITSLWGSSEV
ncbi:hypothetical protein RRG08_023002 [Elysia crispata]|uniref:Uncharacterized protein n=1 Tax=Elysia crispata TaxID=231223 RepID=A0AAE1AFN6_9GAST|nr:hypothetical protein RRG08_023002 [Elysia crispata]